MIFDILFLVIGLALLTKGADFLIDGSSSLAKRLKVSSLAIGLTVVAFGTSLPELIVNIIASLNGASDVAFGNIIGSNIVNILLILGLSAILITMKIQHSTIWKEIPFSLAAAFSVIGISLVPVFTRGKENGVLTATHGIMLLLFFAIYLYYVYELSKKGKSEATEVEIKKLSMPSIILFILGGLVMLFFGGKFTVNSAVTIARTLGISEFLISATIVAIGTSLPELVTSVIAAIKKDADMAVGNIIGSNIFNIFLIFGVSSLINPIIFPKTSYLDIIFLAFSTILLFFFIFFHKKNELKRWHGIIFVILYIAYIIGTIFRG